MGRNDEHIIRRCTFDIEVGSEDDLLHFNNELGSFDLESMVERVIAACNVGIEHIRIEKLELNMGHLQLNEDGSLGPQLEEGLQRALREVLEWAKGGPEMRAVPDERSYWEMAEGLHEEWTDEWDTLRYYLHTGSLPWYAPDDVDLRQLVFSILQESETGFTDRLQAMQLPPAAWFRIFQLIPESAFFSVVRKLTDHKIHRYWEQVQPLLMVQFNGFSSGMSFRWDDIRKEMLIAAIAQRWGLGEFVEHWLGTLRPILIHTDPVFLMQVQKIFITPFLQQNSPVVARTAERINKFFAGVARQRRRKPEDDHTPVRENIAHRNELFLLEGSLPLLPENDGSLIEQPEEYLVTHAGLVLLNAGLLKRSFESLGWVQNGEITDPACATQMRLWMHYLVWGDTAPHEYDLLIAKLLTGILPDRPVALNVGLNKEQRMAADDHLKTVIANWGHLKQTSAEGLRKSFLQRKGILRLDEAGWQLHVETKPHDVLINYLPWPYSITKFPWMEKPLYTQWNTAI
ncbi:MAG TPA: contractile injection system tape measure protein [Phnomibacter sp.]|nr:contractile injection system tape measure protein [Phnomibacter sp.]